MASCAQLSRRHRNQRLRNVISPVIAALVILAGPAFSPPTVASARAGGAGGCGHLDGVSCVLHIPYEDDGSRLHTLDAYFPTDLTDRASVVLIHGGIWRSGHSASFDPEAEYFAENGFAAFSINYTLARRGAPSWPAVGDDVVAATAWVMAHAGDYHGDGTRVGVLGGSSGGELAALVDTVGPGQGVRPLAAVSWSGAMDLRRTYALGNRTARRGIARMLGCEPAACPDLYVEASPVSHVAAGDGSMLLFHSADERVPVSVAYEMNRALDSSQVPHTMVIFKHSSRHARQNECDTARIVGKTLTVIDQTVRFMGFRLGQPTSPTRTFCESRPPVPHD